MRHRILSLDGGGVGGALSARLLARLCAEHPGLLGRMDVVAGTSIGGILALCLADGSTASDLTDLMLAESHTIFGRSTRRGWIGRGLWRARYDPSGLRSVVQSVLGNRRLGELLTPVVVPTVALSRPDRVRCPSAKFWSTVQPHDGDGDYLAWQVAVATASAPTYFPAASVDGGWLLWDGGLSGANNPTAAAIAEIRKLDPHAECVVLSLGTGATDEDFDAGDWGALQSASPVISTMLSVSGSATAFAVDQAMHGRHWRVNPVVQTYGLDDASAVPRLLDAADAVDLSETVEWLKMYW